MKQKSKTSKQVTVVKPKPASISKHAKVLGKLGGRPKKSDGTNTFY